MFELHTKNISEPIRLEQLPTLRQSFVAASLIIITGLALGYFVHKGFLLLVLLVAGGLLFSGTVGFCPMVLIMQHMPWNKR